MKKLLVVVLVAALVFSCFIAWSVMNHPMTRDFLSLVALSPDFLIETNLYQNHEAFLGLRNMILEDKIHSVGRQSIGAFSKSGDKWFSTTTSGSGLHELPEVLRLNFGHQSDAVASSSWYLFHLDFKE